MSKIEIKAHLPGVFYRRSSPNEPELKADGAAVEATEVVGLIEVMKSFHEVPAGVAGKNIRFTVDDGDAVMVGQTIAEVES